jgi:hypothetical protein
MSCMILPALDFFKRNIQVIVGFSQPVHY